MDAASCHHSAEVVLSGRREEEEVATHTKRGTQNAIFEGNI